MFKLASAVHGDDDDDDCDENDANNQCRHCARIVGPGKWFICLALIVPRNHYQKDRIIAVVFVNLTTTFLTMFSVVICNMCAL